MMPTPTQLLTTWWDNGMTYDVPNKIDCCTGGPSSTVPCAYSAGSAQCQTAMARICALPTMGRDPRCRQWAVEYPALAEAGVRGWCAANPNDPWCGCVESKAELNPFCVDTKCINTSAFKPPALIAAPCPANITCQQYNNLVTIGTSIAPTITATMNCGTTGASGPSPKGQPPPKPQSTITEGPTLIYLVAIILLISLIAVVTTLYYRYIHHGSRRVDSNGEYQPSQ
jgi:hypothetical protein